MRNPLDDVVVVVVGMCKAQLILNKKKFLIVPVSHNSSAALHTALPSRGSCAARGDSSSSFRFGYVFLLSLFVVVVVVVVVSCHSLCLHLQTHTHTHACTAYAENVNWRSALAPCFARAYWQIITERTSLSHHSLALPLSLALSLPA